MRALRTAILRTGSGRSQDRVTSRAGGDLVHLGHRSVAFLLLRPLLDDLCVHATARELDAETGIGCSVLGVELELGVGEGKPVGVDHDARGTLR